MHSIPNQITMHPGRMLTVWPTLLGSTVLWIQIQDFEGWVLLKCSSRIRSITLRMLSMLRWIVASKFWRPWRDTRSRTPCIDSYLVEHLGD